MYVHCRLRVPEELKLLSLQLRLETLMYINVYHHLLLLHDVNFFLNVQNFVTVYSAMMYNISGSYAL